MNVEPLKKSPPFSRRGSER